MCAPERPLAVFRDNVLVGCLQDKRKLFRRDFDLDGGETFESKWMTGWAAEKLIKDGKAEMAWPSHRLAGKALWTAEAFDSGPKTREVLALALANDTIYLAGSGGELQARSVSDGKLLSRRSIPEPLWDGLAVAGGRLYVSTRDGKVLCLGQD